MPDHWAEQRPLTPETAKRFPARASPHFAPVVAAGERAGAGGGGGDTVGIGQQHERGQLPRRAVPAYNLLHRPWLP